MNSISKSSLVYFALQNKTGGSLESIVLRKTMTLISCSVGNDATDNVTKIKERMSFQEKLFTGSIKLGL